MGEPETYHFHVFGILGRVLSSQKPNMFIFGDTTTLQEIQEKTNHFFEILLLNISKGLTSTNLNIWEKAGPKQSQRPV